MLCFQISADVAVTATVHSPSRWITLILLLVINTAAVTVVLACVKKTEKSDNHNHPSKVGWT